MLLRKRNLNVHGSNDQGKDPAVKRKNSSVKDNGTDQKMSVHSVPAEVFMMTEDPIPEYDFDKECEHDPNAYAEYSRDVFIYYKYREQFFKVENYFQRQIFLTEEMRMKIVDWLVELQETFELNHETLYLAVKLMDRYLDRIPNVRSDRIQLIASAAVFIASKYDERSPPLVDDFVYLSKDRWARDEIIAMERDVLRGVHFDLGAPLSYRFLRRYARVTKIDMTTLTLARYILETSLLFLEFCRVSESLMALGSFVLAVRMKKIGDWTIVLQKYSGFKLEQVDPLVVALNHMLIRCRRDFRPARTILQKYSHEIFFEVALIPPLPDQLDERASVGPPLSALAAN